MYRAWLEATAFGVRQVLDILADAGFEINEIICGGGIPEKSPLLMQIYADILNRKMLLPANRETCALGAALCGALVMLAGFIYLAWGRRRTFFVLLLLFFAGLFVAFLFRCY